MTSVGEIAALSSTNIEQWQGGGGWTGMIVAKREPVPAQPLRLDRVLHALGDPVRLGIVRQLARDGESSCAALDGGRAKSTMSHHFRVLREAGLVQVRGQGTTHMNSLSRASVEVAFPGLLAAVLAAPDG